MDAVKIDHDLKIIKLLTPNYLVTLKIYLATSLWVLTPGFWNDSSEIIFFQTVDFVQIFYNVALCCLKRCVWPYKHQITTHHCAALRSSPFPASLF